MTEARLQTQSSLTAKIVCYMRALSYLEVGSPIANDNLAELFLSPKVRERIQSPDARNEILVHESLPANYSYITARTSHLDRCCEEAIQRGVEQIVILGAGYDSRAYRFAEESGIARFFEVDAPTTQEAKKKYLGYAGITTPESLTYVPTNFNEQSLEDTLLPAGFKPSLQTLFLWEGVTYYISAEAVEQTLRFVRGYGAPGSQLAFDWMVEEAVKGDHTYHGASLAFAAVSAAGEPFVFGIPEGTIQDYLAHHGFDLLEHYPPHRMQATYLDERFPQMYGFMHNSVAKVQS